jgi:ABC-2 type transport system permease protein
MTVTSGIAADARNFTLLLKWSYLRMRSQILLLVALQMVLGIGIIYGFSFLIPHVTPTVALFFATGAPTLSLVLLGITVVSQETAQARSNGRFDYVAALPIGRLTPMFADVVFWLLVQVPGSIATLFLARVRFDVNLHLSLLLLPAVLLVSLTSAAVGYAIAVSLPPTATNQVASFVSVGLLLFSPINFPLERLPVVLQDVHRVLPITYMADIMRGGLTGQYDANRTLAFGVVTAYCIGGLLLSGLAARRRQ